MSEENEQRRLRRDKLAALRARGEAYPNDFRRSDFAADLHAEYDHRGDHRADELERAPKRVAVAGRMMSRRVMGKAAFADIQDMSGRIQLFVQRDALPDGAYNDEFKKYDLGDIIAAEGELFHTNSGELSVRAERVRLLAKALRPLPDKHHGLADAEMKYRQRYVDLIVSAQTRRTFVVRAAVIERIRAFMRARRFLEVETPMMHPIPGGALARPFATHHNALDMPLYLRIAPELYLKRLVVGGFERVFEINRNFRNEGVSAKHNPEFTMLEFYWAYADYRELMDLTEEMLRDLCRTVMRGDGDDDGDALACRHSGLDAGIQPSMDGELRTSAMRRKEKRDSRLKTAGMTAGGDGDGGDGDNDTDSLTLNYQGQTLDFAAPFARMTLREAILLHTRGATEAVLDDADALRKLAQSHGVAAAGVGKMQMDLFDKTVEHKLIAPTFVTAYPVEVSPLSRRNDAQPDLSDRFELFIAGREIANGFSELNDPEDQAARFKQQLAAAQSADEAARAEAMHFDADYIRALEYGLPPTAGEGIGIDRLVMLLTDRPSIRDVLLFPHMRAEADG